MTRRLLIVDDEPDVIELFRQSFRRETRAGEYDLVFAASGADALQLLTGSAGTESILLLCDINMPGMSGLELLSDVRGRWPQLPVIMITAYGDPANRTRALAQGAADFMTKPIDFVELKRRLACVAAGDAPLMPARILVVDDEPDLEPLIRQKFRRQIGAGDYVFAFARGGEEALAQIAADPGIDLVLSDINMPGMDGLTLLARLKEMPDGLRAVIISAYGDMKNIRTAMNRGAFDFITKPIDFDDLALTIARTLADLQAVRAAERQRADAERARTNLARYFSPNLARHLAEHPDVIELGGERRDLSFLFTDLAGFTPLAEALDAAVIVKLMNDYIGGVASAVFEHGGTVHTVVGDAVYALFGAPLAQTDHAERAVACALAIDAFAQAFARARNAEGIAVGVTRIGVNSGPAIVGNVGGERFFHYTAYGDAINTAARLESANKVLGTRICISGETVRRIADFAGRPIGTLVLKGKDIGIATYEPLNGNGCSPRCATSYRRAFDKLAAGDPQAVRAFATHVGRYQGDALAAFHLKRLLEGETGTRIALAGAPA